MLRVRKHKSLLHLLVDTCVREEAKEEGGQLRAAGVRRGRCLG